jgi:hypothetical protein
MFTMILIRRSYTIPVPLLLFSSSKIAETIEFGDMYDIVTENVSAVNASRQSRVEVGLKHSSPWMTKTQSHNSSLVKTP